MTGYEIRNAMRRAYGFDAANHLQDRYEDDKSSGHLVLLRMLAVISLALKGAR
jgi:hypothetical protein